MTKKDKKLGNRKEKKLNLARGKKSSINLEEINCNFQSIDVNDSPNLIEENTIEVKPTKNNLKLYFNSGTQDSIVKFQQEIIKKEKDRLYVSDIMPAFEKLVENLINIHKFTGMHDTYDELKNDCVNFLFETIHKFDASRGTNAFSYFNVVAKNWLIIRTKQKTQRTKKSVSLDDPLSLTANETLIIEEFNLLPSQDILVDSADAAENTLSLLYEIRSKAKTENELTCINAIITIFENIDEIDLLNKSAVLLYMRELSGLTPKQLTTSMQSIKRHYKKSKIDLKNI
jgi:hypothetical protein